MLVKTQCIIESITPISTAPDSGKEYRHLYVKTLNTDSDNESFREDCFKLYCPGKVVKYTEGIKRGCVVEATLNVKGTCDVSRRDPFYRVNITLVHIKLISRN